MSDNLVLSSNREKTVGCQEKMGERMLPVERISCGGICLQLCLQISCGGKGKSVSKEALAFFMLDIALGRRESNELEDLWREGTRMELLKLVPSERCNYCTCSNRMSEHCYKVRCNHRKEDCSTALLPQNSLCVRRIPTVLINL